MAGQSPGEITEGLVDLARVRAITMLVPLCDRLPALKSILQEKGSGPWDFFATIASVGAGMMVIYRAVPEREMARYEKALRIGLDQWASDGYAAYLDLASFVRRNIAGGVDASSAIGAWVLWNVKSGEPTGSEIREAGVIGVALSAESDNFLTDGDQEVSADVVGRYRHRVCK